MNKLVTAPRADTPCDSRSPRMPCYACAAEGPDDVRCMLPRGHDGEHKALCGEVGKMKTWLKELSGRVHEGVHVHGCNDRQALEREIRRATKGKPLLACIEQSPGHARAYVRTAQADVDERPLDLRGAVIMSVDQPPTTTA